jgi:hypothetical protein
MQGGDRNNLARMQCFQAGTRRPSPAPVRDAQYEIEITKRRAIELYYENERRKAELLYSEKIMGHQTNILGLQIKVFWIIVSTTVTLILGLGGLIVKFLLG